MHSSKFEKNGSCDLLICDEAHRLKNDQTLTNRVKSYFYNIPVQTFSGCFHCQKKFCVVLRWLSNSIMNQALASLPCSRRILLSGTPMQVNLEN